MGLEQLRIRSKNVTYRYLIPGRDDIGYQNFMLSGQSLVDTQFSDEGDKFIGFLTAVRYIKNDSVWATPHIAMIPITDTIKDIITETLDNNGRYKLPCSHYEIECVYDKVSRKILPDSVKLANTEVITDDEFEKHMIKSYKEHYECVLQFVSFFKHKSIVGDRLTTFMLSKEILEFASLVDKKYDFMSGKRRGIR